MSKRAKHLVIVGLILGLAAGVGIEALRSFAAKELISVLDDEVSASCACEFKYDSVELSFLPLTATATNVRIVEAGRDALRFEKLVGHLGLRKVTEKKLLLDELELIRGHADGVGPDSATFKFIDHLAAPIPPERDRPGRWKLKLLGLQLRESSFSEKFGTTEIVAQDVGLRLERTPGNDFNLTPSAGRVAVRRPDSPELTLGKLSLDIFLEDEYVDFRAVELLLKDAWLRIAATGWTGSDNLLEGGLSFALDARSLNLPESLVGAITGSAAIGGTFSTPSLNGRLKNTTPIGLGIESTPPLIFDDVGLGFRCQVGDDSVSADIQSLVARSTALDLAVTTPLSLDRGRLSGGLGVSIREIGFGSVSVRNVRADLELAGTVTDPRLALNARIGRLHTDSVVLPDLGVTVLGEKGRLAVTLNHASDGYGSVRGQGTIEFAGRPTPEVQDFTLSFARLPLGSPTGEGETSPRRPTEISGSATLRGPLTFPGLIGDARFELAEPGTPFRLEGTAELRSTELVARARGVEDTLAATLRLDPRGQRGKLELTLDRFKLPGDADECSELNLAGAYDFAIRSPLEGSGGLELKSIAIGCAPYSMRVAEPARLSIDRGTLTVPRVKLVSAETAITIGGTVSPQRGFDLSLNGDLHLASLLGLIPSLDDLRGKLSAELRVQGPLEKPGFRGFGELTDAGFALEAADLSGDDISGKLDLSDDRIRIEGVKGSLNSGTFDIGGEIYPLDLARSRSALHFNGVTLQPNENTSLMLSGDLHLVQALSKKPVIEGSLSIDSAEFRKNVSLISVVKTLANSVFSKRQAEAFKRSGGPSIELNVQVSGSRNIFVATNWANAELKADVAVRGTIASPTLDGRVETLTGWFGLKNRQFDITSGALIFRPTSPDPILEVMGETSIPTRTGDTVLVILEATGPLASPRIALSSDRGFNERDILALMTQGGRSFAQTRANTIGDDLQTEGLSILNRYSLLQFHRLLASLTRIDSISLEPTFNQQTGLIEPALVAEKRITDRFSVIGESLFGGATRLKALYDLRPDLVASGIIENDPATATAPVEMNLTYTVLARQEPFLKLSLTGNEKISNLYLRRGLRIGESSRVTPKDAVKLGASAVDLYNSLGFFDATAQATCGNIVEGYCRALDLVIQEGEGATVQRIRFEGEEPQKALQLKALDSITGIGSDRPASRELLNERRVQLLRALRNEGFIAARVDGRYVSTADPKTRDLVLSVVLGKPVTFVFRGNTVFGPDRFLETINLFNRRQPFGNNTIHILTDNIERLYREAGYLYATTRYTRSEDPSNGRVTFVIDIVEAGVVPVVGVSFIGNAVLSESELLSLLSAEGLDPRRIRSPSAAVAEEMAAVSEALTAIYVEAGYPDTAVTSSVEPTRDGVAIEYRIVEGGDTKIKGISIVGLPSEITPPQLPDAPFSIPKANRFIDQLLQATSDFGYRTPALSSSVDESSGEIRLEVTPGPLTRIGTVTIAGNTAIARETIERNIHLATGDRWDSEIIDEAKRALLRLGLFSRVSIGPADGAVDGPVEDLAVVVTEHPLQTLEIGGGANSEYGLHIFGEGLDRSLFRDGRTISLRVDTYYDDAAARVSQGTASLRYADPYFLESEYSLTEDIRFQRLDQTTQEFNLDRISLTSSLYRSWDGLISHVFGHTILSENLEDVSPGAIVGEFDEGTVRLGFISGLLTYDHRDSPIDPRSGYTLALDYKAASPILGSEADFYSTGGRVSLIQPLPFDRFSLAFATRIDSAWTYGGTDEVPISQRFYLGGRNSIRGFRENSLGPRGEDGAVIGGDLLFANNLEARYLVTDSTSLHLFLDAGTVFLRSIGVSGDDIRYSTGIGFRFLSPLGPIGFDIGHPLDERSGEPSVRFHFSIGSNF